MLIHKITKYMKYTETQLQEYLKIKKAMRFSRIKKSVTLLVLGLGLISYFLMPSYLLVFICLSFFMLLEDTVSSPSKDLQRLYEDAINHEPENIKLKAELSKS